MEAEAFVTLVEALKGQMSIKVLCEQFGIGRSTYYRWLKTKTKRLTDLEKLIKELCLEHKFRYGYRKITALVRRVRKVSKNTVQRIMRRYRWNCRVKMKKKTKIGQPYKIVGNHLNRQFEAKHRFEKLVTDITYLPFGRKQVYLSSIMDLYNGEIVAYTIGEKQDSAFVLETLEQLPKVSHCLLHSDQGSVYTSYAYQKEVAKRGITMSMSRKGTPADNACIESFHSSLKSETFYLDELTNESTSSIIQIIIDYIDYYNKTRIQQKLDYKSPIEYRQSVV